MQYQDSEQELLEVAEALEEADDAFRRRDYAIAEPIYKRALELMEARYGSGDPDTIVCLQKLGDTYYAMRMFDEALPLYRRLLVVGEKVLGKNHPDVVAMAIKLGTTYEKMDMTEDAAAMYQRAQKLSQSSLVALRTQQGEDEFGEGRRGRSVDPRKLSGNFIDNAVDQDSLDLREPARPPSWKVESKSELTLESLKEFGREHAREQVKDQAKASFSRSRPGSVKKAGSADSDAKGAFIHLLKQNSSLIIAGAALLVVLVLSIFIFVKLSGGERQSTKTPVIRERFKKQAYTTADGGMTVALQSPEEAVMIVGTGQMQSQTKLGLIQMGPAWDDFIDIIFGSLMNKEYWFERVNEGLRAEDGGMLYGRDSPEAKVLGCLGKVAAKAQAFYLVNKTYPTQEGLFMDTFFTNPISFKPEYPSLLEYVSPMATTGGVANDASNDEDIFATLQHVKTGTWQKERPASPCVVHCLTIQKGYTTPPSTEFYAHGFDRNGQLLNSGRGDSVHLVALKNGASQTGVAFHAQPRFNGRAIRVCIVKPPAGVSLVLLHHIVPITLFALALLFFGVSQMSKPKDEFMSQFTILDRISVIFLLLSMVWGLAAVLP